MSEETNDEMNTEEGKQKKGLSTFWKVALGILVALVGLVVLALAWALISYPAEYLLRSISWGDSDVYDYQKFPARPIAASPSPFYFKEEPAEAMVQELFEQHPVIDDLDDFLERTQT
jgi:hypothetical protein